MELVTGPLLRIIISTLAAAVVACSQDMPIPTERLPTNPTPSAPVAASIAPPGPAAAPAPTSTATPYPSPTPLPTAAPTARPEPSPTAAVAEPPTASDPVPRLTDETWAFLQRFTEEMSPRESATEEEEAAAEYLRRELESLGYEVRMEPFTFERLETQKAVRLPAGETLDSIPLRMTGLGTVSAPVEHVGLAKDEDIPEDSLAGRIALIRRGSATFEEKVSRAEDAGAVAAVIYNNVPGLFSGVLQTQADIPVVSISKEDGERLLALIAGGEVEVTVSLDTTTFSSKNIIAERPGDPASGSALVVGAHYDTTPNTQGANDNGSGVAVLMSVARELADAPLPFRLRFILFGAEEVGLFGSRHHVASLTEERIDSLAAMINIDVPGSGATLVVTGDDDMGDRALRYGSFHGIAVRKGAPERGATSDHAPFREAGVPAIFLFADDLSRINSPRDRIEFVEPRLMGEAAALTLGLIDDLASRFP